MYTAARMTLFFREFIFVMKVSNEESATTTKKHTSVYEIELKMSREKKIKLKMKRKLAFNRFVGGEGECDGELRLCQWRVI